MRRVALLVATVVTAVVVAGGAALAVETTTGGASGETEASFAATKIVKKTFSKSGLISIPNLGQATPYPSEKNVSGFKRGRILDVNLKLKNYSHTFPDDVDIMLVAPKGQRATVMSDVGGSTDVNNITLVLDDEAASPLPDGGPLVGGTFKPNNVGGGDAFPVPAPTPTDASALSVFDGKNPNGPWRLLIVDDAGGDVGQFAGGWSIVIKAKVRR